MLQLGKSGASDHVANFGEGIVGAKADAGASEAHPDFAAAALDGAVESTIIDEYVADGGETADAVEGFAAEEDAAAGGSGGAGFRVRNPLWRVEFQEEEEKSGDGGSLGERSCLEQDHERCQVEMVFFGAGDEAGERVGCVGE